MYMTSTWAKARSRRALLGGNALVDLGVKAAGSYFDKDEADAKAAGGKGGVASTTGASVTTAALDYFYGKEQARVVKLMDDTNVVVVRAGEAIQWGKWAVAGLAAAGIYLMVQKARR